MHTTRNEGIDDLTGWNRDFDYGSTLEAGETTQQGGYSSKNNSIGSYWCLFLSQNIVDDRNYQPQGISEAAGTQDDSMTFSDEWG